MCSIARLFFTKAEPRFSEDMSQIASDVQKKCSLELRGCS